MLRKACMALERGSCLELYYPDHVRRCIEVHAVGFDDQQRPAIFGWQVMGSVGEPGWTLLPLADVREVDISGYWSEAPRPGYAQSDVRLSRVLCSL
jgi:hypothetical protein